MYEPWPLALFVLGCLAIPATDDIQVVTVGKTYNQYEVHAQHDRPLTHLLILAALRNLCKTRESNSIPILPSESLRGAGGIRVSVHPVWGRSRRDWSGLLLGYVSISGDSLVGRLAPTFRGITALSDT